MSINLRRGGREKVFGPGRAVPLDRNAKARIAAYARVWSARNRRPGQHKGPITRAFLEVLGVLLWGFHNSRSGCCFPSYETIAGRAGCARSTVAEALKALEWAGVLKWQHRITRVRERCHDLFGRECWQWRVHRSNAYAFRDRSSRSQGHPFLLYKHPHAILTAHSSGRLPKSAQPSQKGNGIEQGDGASA